MALGDQLIEPAEHVVAQSHRHLKLRRYLQHGLRASQRVHAAGIGTHLHISGYKLLGYAADQRREIARIAEQRIGILLLLQNRHGDFCQVVENQVVDGTLLDQADGGFEPIAPESLSIRDANHAGTLQLISSARIRARRVSRGSITPSALPRATSMRASSQPSATERRLLL